MNIGADWGDGISAESLRAAIEKSGYLMQSTVVDKLARHFPIMGHRSFIQEEWTYVDSDSGEIRAVDALVDSLLTKADNDLEIISPYLNLIVECKQSSLPYVFFLRDHPLSATVDFPELGGMANNSISLFFRSEEFDAEKEKKGIFPGYGMSYHDALDLFQIPFFRGVMCPLAISLSKAAWRKGGTLELTGEEAYKSLTLPLVKAMDHLHSLVKSDKKKLEGAPPHMNLRFILGLAVLRVPMVTVSRSSSGEKLENVPWVRMSRLEPTSSPGKARKKTEGNVRLYDIVHEEFLDEYLSHLKEALQEAVSTIERYEGPIFDGIGCTCKTFRRPDTPEGDVDFHRIHKEQAGWLKDGGSADPRYFISATVTRDEKPLTGDGPDSEKIGAPPTGSKGPLDGRTSAQLPTKSGKGRPAGTLGPQSSSKAEPASTDDPAER